MQRFLKEQKLKNYLLEEHKFKKEDDHNTEVNLKKEIIEAKKRNLL